MSNEAIIEGQEGAEEIELELEEGEEGKNGEGKEGEEGKKPKGKYADESPEDRSARLRRMSDQHDKKHKLGKYKEAAPEGKPADTSKKTGELDYGQKAYLVSMGYKTSAEQKVAQDMMANTGKTLDEVLESKFFQGEIKDLREAAEGKAAIPEGTKRSGQASIDSVDYWIAKGELPPLDQPELRQKVVNARMQTESGGSNFTKNPVVGK